MVAYGCETWKMNGKELPQKYLKGRRMYGGKVVENFWWRKTNEELMERLWRVIHNWYRKSSRNEMTVAGSKKDGQFGWY